MPKCEVILTHQVMGLGAESDHVKVSAGYARNFLFPQGLAIPLTGGNKRHLEALRKRRAEREAAEFNTMNELSRSIAKLTALVQVKTGDDGKMFGSVTAGMIADHLKTQFDINLDRKKIHLEHPLRVLGEHEVELRLHPEIHAKLKVKVESTTPLLEAPKAAPTQQAPAEAKEGGERRGRRPARGGVRPGARPRVVRRERRAPESPAKAES